LNCNTSVKWLTRAGQPGFDSQQGQDFSLCHHVSRQTLGTLVSVQRVSDALSPKQEAKI